MTEIAAHMHVASSATAESPAARMIGDIPKLELALKYLQKHAAIDGQELHRERRRLRTKMQAIIVRDIALASQHGLDDKLWLVVHHKTIDAYRTRISRFQAAHGKSRPVELRKLIKPLLKFIRDALSFYQSFTSRLITTYRAAQMSTHARRLNWELGPFQTSRAKAQDAKVDELVRRVCYSNLVRMGDLHRYAELHSLCKAQKRYIRAIEHYDVARLVLPFSGTPYNQLAVVVIQRDLWLDAAYYFVRASAALESFSTARDNLLLHYRKVLSDKSGQYTSIGDDGIRLCAAAMLRPAGDGRQRIARSFFQQLEKAIQERQIETMQLTRLAVIVIGSIYIEQARQFGDQEEDKSAAFKNIAIQLLHSLLRQLARAIESLDEQSSLMENPAIRRILPALSICVSWLKCNVLDCHDIWDIFCTTCRKLAPLVAQLPVPATTGDAEPFVDEDLDLRGFAPLDDGDPSRSSCHLAMLPSPHDQNIIRLRRVLSDAKRVIPVIERRRLQQSSADESQSPSQ